MRKLSHGSSGAVKAGSKASKAKGKDHAYDRLIIPIPTKDGDEEDSTLDEEDTGFMDEYGSAVQFLSKLDEKGIARCVAGYSMIIRSSFTQQE
jgi:nucleolar complex protein 3